MPTDASQLPAIKCIAVDQFGYLPAATKIAILRNPIEGFDAELSFTPGAEYQVVNLDTAEVALTVSPAAWKDGTTNTTSGDRVWWLDISALSAAGRYVLVDAERHVRSVEFQVADNPYRPLLIEAVRTFFYQRAGFAKQAPYADAGWVDGASHLGAGQDTQARLYNQTGDASTERDLSGGWYDAGDYNKYTNWHASYLVSMMHIYNDRPGVFTDDFNIPESGNGLPDWVDEIKWGMDWLVKMQEADGSLLSVMGLGHASPPSAATGPSVYGPSTTSASYSGAAAFALGAEFFSQFNNDALNLYAQDLATRAEQAWSWAEANPEVTFRNSDNGVAAGEQEVDANGRAEKKLMAAIYLFALTGDTAYRDYVDANTPNIGWVAPWNEELLHTLLHYASLANATGNIASAIEAGYVQSMQSVENWGAVNDQTGAYRAYLGDGNYTWGSSRTMGVKGSTFYHLKKFGLGDNSAADIESVALGYINYLHGTNAMGKVYLSNMAQFGAEDSVDSFYHSWFTDGSADWDSVSQSNYGPAPGFVIGGANPQYNWDSCCPDSCGNTDNNARCGMAPPAPPFNQPPMKSYADFNDGWPINSWQVTENSNGYQLGYIRLLSKFVD
ncbi:glycoside hydrolase family 9 protein [Gilvimarinus sp. SDUM040013]|uniref:Glycoside hydrolase family 9 protein n=1 Tax=Gilvimarinus gilvus TaxID=3058038 RepID=A0ABU4RW65_9GAMM|nr:glycoside hydrolase family 9 protein [Gilvimarinus sp. SDUM040013]MDO3386539.1 glycoside hydrolase family 9 protein [Gilvimarinus sp. SDUM040013]MDX6849115.1 glycoside hydrolase family 9 protein [Gilvimarinus sp. SDUM040013]